MSAAIERKGIDQYLGGVDIADIDNIEQAVIDRCVGCDHHASAKKACIGYAKTKRPHRPPWASVETQTHPVRITSEHFLKGCNSKVGFAADPGRGDPIKGFRGLYSINNRG